MCISQNRGGHHGRLVIPPLDVKIETAVPENVRSSTERSHGKHGKAFRMVSHHYHDHVRDRDELDAEDSPSKLDKAQFPVKLHAILDHIEEDGLAHAISWQPHGRCFKVHKQALFMSDIMPKYFQLHKYASFQRQLNLYGFQRLTQGPDKNSYYHEYFLRNRPNLAKLIRRTRVKGTRVRPRSNPREEPDFYSMPSVDDESPVLDQGLEDVTMGEAEEGYERNTPSPSPAVVDTRTPNEKLSSAFPTDTVSSNVIPYETASSHVSEIRKSDSDNEEDDDKVIIFEGKPFHYLDPFQVVRERLSSAPTLVPSLNHEENDEDRLFTDTQMDALLERLNTPGGIWSVDVDNMDEQAFGNVLESIVQCSDKCVL